MTVARNEIVIEGEDGIYHCTSRCVRQGFLCGLDKLTGKNFDYRKDWIRERIIFLLTIFCIELLAYALMSNHLHTLIRTLQSTLCSLSNEEVARRWLMLYPRRRNPDGTPCEPSENEIKVLINDPDRIQELRARLGSVSWFMKSLNEYVARRANKEDGCKGRFWEGRYKCQRVESEAAVLTCSVYVDLNPIRAEAANTPEESVFTSAWERIEALSARKRIAALEKSGIASEHIPEILRERSTMDAWLTPIQETEAQRGFLSINLAQYLSVLDWSGRQLRYGKRGKIPAELKPIMERIGLNPDKWVDSTRYYGKWFYRFVSDAESMARAATAAGKGWFQGLTAARQVFQVAATA